MELATQPQQPANSPQRSTNSLVDNDSVTLTASGSDHASLAVMHASRALELWWHSSLTFRTWSIPANNENTDWVLYPDKPRKASWDRFVMLLVVYCSVMAPVRVCFDAVAAGFIWKIEALISILLFVDVVLSFRTAYLEGGKYVVDPGSIARRYLSGWFWIDAPSSVPVEILEWLLTLWQALFNGTASSYTGDAASGVPIGEEGSELRMLRLFRLARLLRLLRLDALLNELELAFDVSMRPLRLIQLVAKVVFADHLSACFFFLMPDTSQLKDWSDGGRAEP